MIYRSLAALLLVMTSISSYAEATNDEILNELKALRKEVSELKAEVAKKNREQTSTSSIQPPAFVEKKADVKKLKEITLKENPSKAEINEYFDKIDELSNQQNNFNFSNDPQCKMIMKVGKENAELMLERLDNRSTSQGYYREALKRLADDKIKDMIIKKLSEEPSLINIIKEKHWENDAKTVILAEYKRNSNNPQWMELVASYRVPETYPDLKKEFLTVPYNQAYIYKILSDIPEITFTKEEINRVWNRIPKQDQFSTMNFALVAASYGNKEAFNMLFRFLQDKNPQNSWIKDNLKTSIYDILDCDVSFAELPEWYNKNKDKFVFDENSKRFIIK